jgi:hypothetical protein
MPMTRPLIVSGRASQIVNANAIGSTTAKGDFMTVTGALLVGLLAFVGAMFGHLVAFDLNATSRRREVRRNQIERLAEFLSEDVSALFSYQEELLFGKGEKSKGHSPYEKAYAIYILYFWEELADKFSVLIAARQKYKEAIDLAFVERLNTAIAGGKTSVAGIAPSKLAQDNVLKLHEPYYQAVLDCLASASKIAQTTIPAQSTLKAVWFACVAKGKRSLAFLSAKRTDKGEA